MVSRFRYGRGNRSRRYAGVITAQWFMRLRNLTRIIEATLGAHQSLLGLRRAIYGKHRLGAEFVSELIQKVNLSGTVIP